jgi:hypothetical protein
MNVKPNQQEGINPWDQKHHLHHIVNPCVYGMQLHRGCRPWEPGMQNWSANNPFIASDRSWWIARTEHWPPGGKLGSVWEKRWQVGESSLSQHCPCCPELACHKSHVAIYSLFLENHQHSPAVWPQVHCKVDKNSATCIRTQVATNFRKHPVGLEAARSLSSQTVAHSENNVGKMQASFHYLQKVSDLFGCQ